MRNFVLSLPIAGAAIALTFIADVNAKDLNPDLRQQVIASCSSDAIRLCPQSLSSQDEAVSCMRKKRHDLTPVCRAAYEQVVRVLAQR
jgi:hypothetical protein